MHNDLPAGITDWLSDLGRGSITRLERAVARREAWIVDVTRSDGSVLEGFLRLERKPDDANPWSLGKETAIVRALAESDVPVSAVHGSSEELACTLFERLGGRPDLQNAKPDQQQAVMFDFMEVVARLHTLSLDKVMLPPMPRPSNSYECALGEMELVLARWSTFLDNYRDPLLTFGLDWLRRNAPAHVERISLVQGDTGPMNFMFEGNRVTAIFDWEWGHFGDPMEDLGNICVREFWNPCGGLDGMFARYEQASGMHVDLDSVRYYRVQQQMRGMVPSHCATVQVKSHEPLAWYLAYRYVGDRATCEAIADAMHIQLKRPEFPPDDGSVNPLTEAASWALKNDIAPATSTPLAKARVDEVDIILRCMERVARYQSEIHQIECDEISDIIGKRFSSLEDAFDSLDQAITERALPDESIIRYLARRAYRNEWLFDPCTKLFPNRQWAEI